VGTLRPEHHVTAGGGCDFTALSWGGSDNCFHSINAGYPRVFSLGGQRADFQYATFLNTIAANTDAPQDRHTALARVGSTARAEPPIPDFMSPDTRCLLEDPR
jgi:hypothetical protein